MTERPLVGRLAPSPTGHMHLGNIRSFLLAWLDVRSRNGSLLLRIEDLDGPRIKRGAAEQIIEDFKWLGFDYDGQEVYQSNRLGLYAETLKLLIELDLVYPCVCTRRDIELAASAPHTEDGARVYPRTCYQRFKSFAAAEAASGRQPCWRMKMPSTAIDFVDGFMGRQTFSGTELGDFVVYKNNSEPAYQLSVVVDDSAQQVTEVLRGDDLLDSAARQLVLYDALGLEAPQFKHLPLVRGGDGLRLAKRHGDTSLHYFRQQGVRQQQLIGWIAYKSGLIDSYQELAPQDLLANFNLANVKPEPLTWKNGFEGLI